MKFEITELTPTACRQALTGFWNDACAMECTPQGLVMTLPILLADGWQVTVNVEREFADCVVLRDRGQLNSWLLSNGVDIRKDWFQESVQALMKEYGVQEDGRGYFKMFHLPLDACEIQLFGAFLSSLSHQVLRVRREGEAPAQIAYTNVLNVVRRLSLPCEKDKEIKTAYRKIVVDVMCPGIKSSAAVQTFDQSTRASQMFEIWSSRLREIAESSDGMYKTCMVYDEDGCRISADLLNVAKSRVNHVIPCQREDELEDILKASVA